MADKSKKFVHVKSSLYWTFGHIAELIAKNDGYTLAEVSENSFENWIKAYLDTTENHGRHTSVEDTNNDCLRAMWLHSKQDIRQFDKPSVKKQDGSDLAKELTKEIHDFFIINEDGKKWSFQG